MEYEVIIQQTLRVEATSRWHAERLVLENTPKVEVFGAGCYDGQVLSYSVYTMPNDLPVFFRRIAPIAGNIEEAGSAKLDSFSSFGIVSQCLIIEPMIDEDDTEDLPRS